MEHQSYSNYFRLPDSRKLSNPFVYFQPDGVTLALGWRQVLPARLLTVNNFPFEYTFDEFFAGAMIPNDSIAYLEKQTSFSGAQDRILCYVPTAQPPSYPSINNPPLAQGWGIVPREQFESVFGAGTLDNIQNTKNLLQIDEMCIAMLEGCRARIERIEHPVNKAEAYRRAFHFAGMYRYFGEGVYYPNMLLPPGDQGFSISEFFPKRSIVPVIHWLNIQGYW